MSAASDGGPAFPVPSYVNADGDTHESKPSGMTLRDYFAAKVLAAEITTPSSVFDDMSGTEMATYAYRMADFMLKERAK